MLEDRDAARLVHFAGQLRQELVRCHANRAGQTGLSFHFALNALGHHAPGCQQAVRRVGELGIDFVDATILHARRMSKHHLFKAAREMMVLLEIHRQEDGIRTEFCSLHQAHARVHTKGARLIRGRGNYTAPGIIAQAAKLATIFGTFSATTPAADNHGSATQLRVSQQLDGSVERIHIDVRHSTQSRGVERCIHRRGVTLDSPSDCCRIMARRTAARASCVRTALFARVT